MAAPSRFEGVPVAPRGSRYIDTTRAFYRDEVRRHGLNHRGVGWGRRHSQQRRFRVLAQVGDLEGARVLDVGAGLGDFLAYLRHRDIDVDYTGLDLCDHLADAARARFEGDRDCRFVVGDIMDFHRPGGYDYVIASGVFGLATGETAARMRPMVEQMFRLCRRAVAVNFLSARAQRQAARSYYAEPRAVLDWCLDLTPAVSLRHDYLPNDFTLYLYREPRWPALGERRDGKGEGGEE